MPKSSVLQCGKRAFPWAKAIGLTAFSKFSGLRHCRGRFVGNFGAQNVLGVAAKNLWYKNRKWNEGSCLIALILRPSKLYFAVLSVTCRCHSNLWRKRKKISRTRHSSTVTITSIKLSILHCDELPLNWKLRSHCNTQLNYGNLKREQFEILGVNFQN
jgi:hypothetical protein